VHGHGIISGNDNLQRPYSWRICRIVQAILAISKRRIDLKTFISQRDIVFVMFLLRFL
jgi:hypothetical protein